MVRNGKGRKGEQRWLCQNCNSSKSDAIELVSIDAELAVAAKKQGIDITKLSNNAIADEVDFDELPYSCTSYREATAVLKEFKLEWHFPLVRAVASALDKAGEQS